MGCWRGLDRCWLKSVSRYGGQRYRRVSHVHKQNWRLGACKDWLKAPASRWLGRGLEADVVSLLYFANGASRIGLSPRIRAGESVRGVRVSGDVPLQFMVMADRACHAEGTL